MVKANALFVIFLTPPGIIILCLFYIIHTYGTGCSFKNPGPIIFILLTYVYLYTYIRSGGADCGFPE